MDVSYPVCNAKKQKLCEEQNTDKVGNVIDDLPAMTLQHILSFLPTKDAVQTTILSKRWENQWMSISNLDFVEWKWAQDKRTFFMNFVERVLLLRDPSSIHKFLLSCDVLSDEPRINAWISTALGYKVQELHLGLKGSQEPFVLPLSLFTHDSLRVMKLGMDCYLKLPSHICFSSLKKLTLEHVVFPDGHLTQKLFSGCPVLEELFICYCSWENVKAVCISTPMLRKLKIFDQNLVVDEDRYDNADDEYYDNDMIDRNCCQIVIFGTNLKSFSFSGELRHDYCLLNTSSLAKASVLVERTQYLSGIRGKEANRAYKLLKVISDVEKLYLSHFTVEALSYTKELVAHLPVFSNLAFLQFDIWSVDLSCEALPKILQNSPCLETLKFRAGVELSTTGEWNLDPVPPCFSTHLKVITMFGYFGSESELRVIEILLKNATVLERFIIDASLLPSDGYMANRVEGSKEQILLFPKGSISCEIEFW